MLLEREACLEVLAGPPGRLILIGGEAGAGKTALVREFAAGRRVLWGACDPLVTPRPLGPLLDVAEAAGGELFAATEAGARPARACRRRCCVSCAASPGTVLVLEDVHWADEGTLDVLRMLGRRISGVPALVVGHVTATTSSPTHPLRLVLGELATAAGVERIRVPPLSAEAVRELAAPHGVDGNELHERTGGNPFYVTEVLSAAGRDDPGDRPRRRARPRGVAERRPRARLLDPAVDRARCGRAGARVAAGRRRARRVRRLRHAAARRPRDRVPARAGAAGGRGRDPAAPACRAAPRRARSASRRAVPTRRDSPTTPRPRPTAAAVLRHATERGRACRPARRASPGGRAVRPRAALGGRTWRPPSGPCCSRSSATSAT